MADEQQGQTRRARVEGEGPVRVPATVLAGLEAVLLSGLTNMLDRPRVIEIARAFGADEAAAWIEEHRPEYARGVFAGFEAEEESGGAE